MELYFGMTPSLVFFTSELSELDVSAHIPMRGGLTSRNLERVGNAKRLFDNLVLVLDKWMSITSGNNFLTTPKKMLLHTCILRAKYI